MNIYIRFESLKFEYESNLFLESLLHNKRKIGCDNVSTTNVGPILDDDLQLWLVFVQQQLST